MNGKNILINGLKAKAGGGKNIFENFVKLLSESVDDHKYYVLTPGKAEYRKYAREHLIITDVETIFKRNLFFPALYFLKLPLLLKRLKIDLIFNFGDVIIPTSVHQIYFFDWANAVTVEKYIWNKMSAMEFVVSKTKIFLIRKYIKKVKLTIAQTQYMADKLRESFGLNEIVVIPTPVGIDFLNPEITHHFNLPREKVKFLFPAGFSSHKNFDVIIPLAKLIKKFSLPYLVIITIDKTAAKTFLNIIETEELDCVRNIGKVDGVNMPSLYHQCDVLFLPTLLESFGLPFVEAMACKKPIITSDLGFAHAICEEIALYFDPFDENSILATMQNVFCDHKMLQERIRLGEAKINELPDWTKVFSQFKVCMERLLN